MLRLALKVCLQKSASGDCVCDRESPCGYYTGGKLSAYDTSRVTEMNELFKDFGSFNHNVSSWNTSSVTSMWRMFYNARNFNQDLSPWDVSSVTDFKEMFYNARNFNGDLSNWNTSLAKDMSYMFYGANTFDKPIGSWQVSAVTDMKSCFHYAYAFNQPLDAWDVSQVTDMTYMFRECVRFNQDLNSWHVSTVTNFYGMFRYATSFNGDVVDWDVQRATNMAYMFYDAYGFNRYIRKWQVVGDIGYQMFTNTRFVQSFTCPGDAHGPPTACYVKSFSSSYALEQAVEACFAESSDGDCKCASSCGEAGLPISLWNTSGIIFMQTLFKGRARFNQDLSAWDTSQVIDMYDMFRDARSFNQDVRSWLTGAVTDMSNMFNGASSFDYDISAWSIQDTTSTVGMFKGAFAYRLKFECTRGDDSRPSECTNPSQLGLIARHWIDLSSMKHVQTAEDTNVLTSFSDKLNNTASTSVFGAPKYITTDSPFGVNNFVDFTDEESRVYFEGDGGAYPEVFIVYNVLEFVPRGSLFGDTDNGYGFGLLPDAPGDDIVCMGSAAGPILAQVDGAIFGRWHVANVLFGQENAFITIDGGATDTFAGIDGKYSADNLKRVTIGGVPWANHHVPNLMGEVLIFNSTLDEDSRGLVTDCLVSKWGVNESIDYVNDFDQSCETNGWTLDGSVAGSSTCTQCGSAGWILGGENVLGKDGSVFRKFTYLPSHSSVNITLELLAIASWDGERFQIYVDDELAFTSSNIHQWRYCWDNPEPIRVSFVAQHDALDMELKVNTTLDQHASDEAFGLKHAQFEFLP